MLEDADGNRYALDEDEGLILLSAPAPERDERGRFLPREGAEAAVSESADTQPETERDDEDEETE